MVGSYIKIERAEVEDLIPTEIIIKVIDRMIREPEAAFEDHYESGKPIFLKLKHGLRKAVQPWREVGRSNLQNGSSALSLTGADVPPDTLNMWMRLFKDFQVGKCDEVN